jgi:transposase-like protein
MTIVPLGKVVLQVPNQDTPNFALQMMRNIRDVLPGIVGRMLEESLDTELDRFLGRDRYKRRKHSKRKETNVKCSKCHSQERQDFRRNGHYGRGLATEFGHIQVAMPQIKCKCGGNVRFSYKTIPPRQRMGADVEASIQVDYARGLSYRQIKVKLDEDLQTSVGLRTLNEQVLALGGQESACTFWEKGEAPPVVRVDGIWVTVMFPSGGTRRDKAGRLRATKKAKKIPILAAQGVWPSTGRTELIAWMRADGEDEGSWCKLLEMLWNSGLTPANGLVMLASDGSKGFEAAYQKLYWMVLHQRCVFHKLKNVGRALDFPSDWDRQTKKEHGTEFLRSASRIWQATDKPEALQVYSAFCKQWEAKQPKALKTLARDFEATLTFYDAQEKAERKGEHWPSHLLRTTSPLERMFREYRRRFRQAVLFHSTTGLQATSAQLATRFS